MNSNAKIALISDLQVSGRLVLVELLGICRLHVEILRFGSLGVRLRVRVSSVCARVFCYFARTCPPCICLCMFGINNFIFSLSTGRPDMFVARARGTLKASTSKLRMCVYLCLIQALASFLCRRDGFACLSLVHMEGLDLVYMNTIFGGNMRRSSLVAPYESRHLKAEL